MDRDYLFLIITTVTLSAAVVATITHKKYKDSTERYFLPFLWFSFLLDFSGGVMGNFLGMNTFWLYNLFMLVSFSFYFFWYFTILEEPKFKKAIVPFGLVFLGVALWDYLNQGGGYHKNTFVTGALLTLFCTMFHFWQLLNSSAVLNIRFKLSFWISTGLVLFNMGMIPLMLLSGILDFGELSYLILIISLNVLLYGCYIVGFLWTKQKYNRF